MSRAEDSWARTPTVSKLVSTLLTLSACVKQEDFLAGWLVGPLAIAERVANNAACMRGRTPESFAATERAEDTRAANDGNATLDLDQPSEEPLEGAPAADVRAPGEGGPAGECPGEAADATADAMRVLTTQGLTWQEAWEQTRETYLLPPEDPEQRPKMPKSHGYLAYRDLMNGLAKIG